MPVRRERWIALLLIVVLALATRAWLFGNPVIAHDEQFYLVAGDRFAQGYVPYVDVWDRKPVGLFLIYGFVCRFLADPVLGYQLLASLFAVLTGWLLFMLGRRMASFPAALAGALAYIAWLPVFEGSGGQAPVFYNLPMALAAGLILSALARPYDRGLTWRGGAAMLLTGIAIQVKYMALFEGLFFGISLMGIGLARGRPLTRVAADASVWVACALAPTLAAWAVFAALGHGEAFAQANFLSVFADRYELLPALERLASLNLGLLPFWICAVVVLRHRQRDSSPAARASLWTIGWAGSSYAGFLLFGAWYDHHLLAVLPPACLVAARAFDTVTWRRTAMAIMLGLGLVGGLGRAAIDYHERGNAGEMARLTARIEPLLKGRCLYVHDGLPVLYYLTQACLPTRFVFPDHLTWTKYASAIGVDQASELRRVMASRPGVIVVSEQPDSDSPMAGHILAEAIARDYRLAGVEKIGTARFYVHALDAHRPAEIDKESPKP